MNHSLRQIDAGVPAICLSACRAVGGTVHVEVERGGQPIAADIRVQDLHAGEGDAGAAWLLECLAGRSVLPVAQEERKRQPCTQGQGGILRASNPAALDCLCLQ
jgi:hypothetical protein